MEKKKIAVLFGSCSTEYEVSLKSAAAVVDNFDCDKYEVILIGITRDGRWYRYYGDTENIRSNSWFESGGCVKAILSPSREVHGIIEFSRQGVYTTKIDAAFPVLHGKNGEDGTIQGLLELAGIPFVGCGVLSSALCMDKDIAHKLAALAGVKTPRSLCITDPAQAPSALAFAKSIGLPVYIKPVNAGSSIGITKACREKEVLLGIQKAFDHDGKVLVEENIDGFEVGCAVLGNDRLVTGEVDEIEIQDGFFDYLEKYTLKTSRILLPARIDRPTAQKIKDTAQVLYRALCCKGFARVDLFLTPQNEVVFNEINTIPGFTATSRYPNMLGAAGISYKNLLDQLISLALEGSDPT